MHSFQFDKGTQSLNFFAIKEGGVINYMKAIKLCWVADRYHLRKYGRSISDDSYKAMKYGPVPSSTKDIAICSESFLTDTQKAYLKKYIEKCGKTKYKSVKKLADDLFSDSDIEALSFAYTTFGKFDEFQLVHISHAFPEWKKFADSLEQGMKVFDMSYEDFFKNPDKADPKLDVLSSLDPFALSETDLEQSRENYLSRKRIDDLWD